MPASPLDFAPSSQEVTAGPSLPRVHWIITPNREEMSYQPGTGGRDTGSPFLCHRELMLAAGCQGRKTNQCSIFKFSCGHYPRSPERRSGRQGRLLGEGGGGQRTDQSESEAPDKEPLARPAPQRGSSCQLPFCSLNLAACQASNRQASTGKDNGSLGHWKARRAPY